MSAKFTYCPICQLPLKAISISPDIHVSMCMTRCDDGEIEDCPQGVHCLSTDVFHYRDFSHKLLAAYRSSSDFIPPNVDIKPSPKKRKTPLKQPKRSSPRKKKSPSSSDLKSDVVSGSESYSEVLTQTKRPRKNLKFNENSEGETSSNKNKFNCTKLSSKRNLRHSADSPKDNKTKTSKGCSEVNSDISMTTLQKSTIVNVSLNSSDELRFTKSRPITTLSSLSVATVRTSNVKSDLDSEASESSKNKAQKHVSKIVLKEAVLTLDRLKTCNEKFKTQSKPISNEVEPSNLLIKEPILTIERLKIHDKQMSSESIIALDEIGLTKPTLKLEKDEMGNNCSQNRTDVDDMIPGSMLDKEQLKTTRKKSPAVTLHNSECNGSVISASSAAEAETTDGENDCVEFPVTFSSPEVIIPSRPLRKSIFLSSSSDSDLPLSKLITKKPETVLNKITEIKGKVKAGRVLRTTNNTAYLNGSSLLKADLIKPDMSTTSDKESDSGKSSGHTDTDVSFVPSEKSGSSLHSDSVLSAQSTDRLTASSNSSTYTSSESYTESRSSDPSYLGESDVTTASRFRGAKYSSKYDKVTPVSPRKKHVVKGLSSVSEEVTSISSSSSSEISMREKLLFGNKKPSKPSTKKTPPKLIKSPIKTKQSFKASTLGLLDTTDSDDKSEWQSLLSKMRSGCFPSDLKIDSEDSLTVVSSGSDTSQASNMLPLRQCPFYKRIPDTPFAVDAFQYWNIPGVKIYFLSHFHSDHYIGLKKNFAHPIYCTQITANLVRMKLRVEEKWLRVIEVDQPQIISGVEVTALDANHCPGSVMFLFSLTNGRNHLHVGDFRACKAITFYPSLRNISISKLFLDTTYCSPQYCFPTQEEVIARVVDIVRNQVKAHPRTLVVCGSYTIGKEKVFLGIAEALDWQVWARPEKQRVFTCLNDPRINTRLVKDCRSANVHVLPMASLQMRCLQQHLESCTGAFSHVIGVKPTGWELNAKSGEFKVTSRDNITIYGVPYSEHSSFTELRDFVQFLQPHEIVPTVNMGSAASRGKMSKHFSDWLRPTTQIDGKVEKQTKVSQYFKMAS